MTADITIKNIKNVKVENNLMIIETKGGAIPSATIDLSKVSIMGFDCKIEEEKDEKHS